MFHLCVAYLGREVRVYVPIRTAGVNVDNATSLRSSQPSVSACSLTKRENTRHRSAGDEATLTPVRARFLLFFSFSFFLLFPHDEVPISRLEPLRACDLYKYACRRNVGGYDGIGQPAWHQLEVWVRMRTR